MPYKIALLIVTLVGLVSAPSLARRATPDLGLTNDSWEALGTKRAIVLKRQRLPNTKLFVVRGETVLDHPIERVASVICDHSRWLEWTDNMSSSALLGFSPEGEKIVYQSFSMPPLIANRDVVYQFDLYPNDDGAIIEGSTRSSAGAPPTVGVRMELLLGRWTLTTLADGRTGLILEVLMDPKGTLPHWFVNIIQRDYPVDTLTSLREQLAKSDVRSLPTPLSSCNL